MPCASSPQPCAGFPTPCATFPTPCVSFPRPRARLPQALRELSHALRELHPKPRATPQARRELSHALCKLPAGLERVSWSRRGLRAVSGEFRPRWRNRLRRRIKLTAPEWDLLQWNCTVSSGSWRTT